MQHEMTLRLIDEIARAGSIRGAAEKMAITPSALNRRLLAIEDELGVQLFERLATGVRLNAAGELFVSHARRQLADMKRVRSQIEDLRGARRGHVQIAYDNSLKQAGVLSSALAAYQEEHPGVSFGVDVMEIRDIAPNLIDYRADLGYMLYPKTDTNITSLAAAPAQIVVVSRPDHALAGKGPLRLDALASFPIVLPPEGSLRLILDLEIRRRGLALTPVVEANLDFARPRIMQGDAICFEVDTGHPLQDPFDGLARTPLSSQDVSTPHVHLVQLRGRALSVAAGRFAEGIKQQLARVSA